MEEVVGGSQTETNEVPTPERDAETEALYSSFGLTPTVEKKEIEFPDLTKSQQEEVIEEEPPAIEEQPKNFRTVKHNKKEVEVPEDQIDELLQKGLALDKERERKSEYEKALQRAAKLSGKDSIDDYLASLDKIEEQAKQRELDQFNELKQQLREDVENAGLDPDKVEQFLENHPLMKQAKDAVSKLEKQDGESKVAQERAALEKQWGELFAEHPDLANAEESEWLTPEMDERLKRGYHPLDAYKLAHADKLQTQSKKQLEQKLIKQQHLGTRAEVITQTSSVPDEPTLLPAQMSLAAEFGVTIDGVKQQQKTLDRRR